MTSAQPSPMPEIPDTALDLTSRLADHLALPLPDVPVDALLPLACAGNMPWVDPSLVMPSVGSWCHFMGACRPCAWFHHANGCQHGADCAFCHLCPPGEIKRRKKIKYQLLKQRDERARKQTVHDPKTPPMVPFEAFAGLSFGDPALLDTTPSTRAVSRDVTPSHVQGGCCSRERRFETDEEHCSPTPTVALPTQNAGLQLPSIPIFPEAEVQETRKLPRQQHSGSSSTCGSSVTARSSNYEETGTLEDTEQRMDRWLDELEVDGAI